MLAANNEVKCAIIRIKKNAAAEYERTLNYTWLYPINLIRSLLGKYCL